MANDGPESRAQALRERFQEEERARCSSEVRRKRTRNGSSCGALENRTMLSAHDERKRRPSQQFERWLLAGIIHFRGPLMAMDREALSCSLMNSPPKRFSSLAVTTTTAANANATSRRRYYQALGRQQEADAVAHAACQNLLPPPSYASDTPFTSSSASHMFST